MVCGGVVPWSLGLVWGVRVALVARPIASTVKLVVPRSWSVMAVRVESACQVKSRPATGASRQVLPNPIGWCDHR